MATTGVTAWLAGRDQDLVTRHTAGDFGQHGDFYEIDVTDEELQLGSRQATTIGVLNKIGALSGLGSIISEYVVRDYRIWVITESGDNLRSLQFWSLPGWPAQTWPNSRNRESTGPV
ncbi:MAG: hypothetical protein R3C44_16615 [Chloroflexota bacterium]